MGSTAPRTASACQDGRCHKPIWGEVVCGQVYPEFRLCRARRARSGEERVPSPRRRREGRGRRRPLEALRTRRQVRDWSTWNNARRMRIEVRAETSPALFRFNAALDGAGQLGRDLIASKAARIGPNRRSQYSRSDLKSWPLPLKRLSFWARGHVGGEAERQRPELAALASEYSTALSKFP